MNILSTRSRISRSGLAATLLGVVAMGAGCDAVDGMMALARTTATQAATGAASGLIGGVIDDLLGTVIPDTDGA
jgi:hypothetical protein